MAPKHKLRAADLRKASPEERERLLREAEQELVTLRHKAAMGTLTNPGRLRELRRNVARILTIEAEERRRGEKG